MIKTIHEAIAAVCPDTIDNIKKDALFWWTTPRGPGDAVDLHVKFKNYNDWENAYLCNVLQGNVLNEITNQPMLFHYVGTASVSRK